MKKLKFLALAVLCSVLLVSCGDNGAPNPEHSGGYLEERAYTDLSLIAIASADVTLSEDDVSLIAHLVSCEAGDFPYMTQVCLAAMILNRIDDHGFPANARGVVFDSGDFKSVMSGKVTGTLPAGCTASKKYRVALKAVNDALSGNDPTGGALYFAETDDNTSYVNLSYECGGMIFGK